MPDLPPPCSQFPPESLKRIREMIERAEKSGQEQSALLDSKMQVGEIVKNGRILGKHPPGISIVYAAGGEHPGGPTTRLAAEDILMDIIKNRRPVVCRAVRIAGRPTAECHIPAPLMSVIADEWQSVQQSVEQFKGILEVRYGSARATSSDEEGQMASELRRRQASLIYIIGRFSEELTDGCHLKIR